MELWSGSLRGLQREVRSGALAGHLLGSFYQHHRSPPSPGELRSWEASPAALVDALEPLVDTDLGVTLEYHMPLSGKRLDAVLLGLDEEQRARGLVVELKQWSTLELGELKSLNVVVDGQERVHPSQQAFDYVGMLGQVHSSVVEGTLSMGACSFLHNAPPDMISRLRDDRFADILTTSPVFGASDAAALVAFTKAEIPNPDGKAARAALGSGRFLPSPKLLEIIDQTINADVRWCLVDTQRLAYNTIFAAVDAATTHLRKKTCIIVRGGPGTGKTVIAVQLLADALRREWKAVHVTGGKAFTTALKSKFDGADELFRGNMNLRNAATNELDLVLVDEAHRIRATSDTRFTPKAQQKQRTQMEELLNAGKVVVFFLDENQFMRPDEIGSTKVIREGAEVMKPSVRVQSYDLDAQFRCGGCAEYPEWIDYALGFRDEPGAPIGDRYALEIVDSPSALDELVSTARASGERARLLAGFCWRWSDPNEDGSLPHDVVVGDWSKPWNAKREEKKQYRPKDDPYTVWAETPVGEGQVGCIYSAQGFEFDRVGVIWGLDLVWRNDQWVAQRGESHDKPVKQKKADTERLLRNAYRVLLTRGMKETRILCLDPETAAHLKKLREQVR